MYVVSDKWPPERMWGAITSIAVGKQWVMLMSRIVIRARLFVFPLTLLFHGAIENIVLRDEDDIEQQTDVCQAEFDRVARQAAPVCLQRAVNKQLNHAQESAAEVEQLLSDRLSDGRLPLEVGEDLRDIFPDGQNQFDVLDSIDLIGQC